MYQPYQEGMSNSKASGYDNTLWFGFVAEDDDSEIEECFRASMHRGSKRAEWIPCFR